MLVVGGRLGAGSHAAAASRDRLPVVEQEQRADQQEGDRRHRRRYEADLARRSWRRWWRRAAKKLGLSVLSVTLHRADDGSLGLLVEYEGGLPVVAAPAPGGLVAGDVITAIDGVTLQPGWKLSDVIERRELHELQVLRHT